MSTSTGTRTDTTARSRATAANGQPKPKPKPGPARDPLARPKVYLAMPLYSSTVLMQAAHGLFVNATQGACDIAAVIAHKSTATPHCFNRSWAEAMDRRDRGEVTHFGMLHSDVEPPARWLDLLWFEMQKVGAAAISAVAAIKNEEGKTSTAVGLADDPYSYTRYITSADRATLPETFVPADVCGPDEVLLINTGCMLVDLRVPDLWDNFAFEFRTRIEPGPDGARVARFAPEDWLLSRHVQAHGYTVAATWRLNVRHHGEYAYTC